MTLSDDIHFHAITLPFSQKCNTLRIKGSARQLLVIYISSNSQRKEMPVIYPPRNSQGTSRGFGRRSTPRKATSKCRRASVNITAKWKNGIKCRRFDEAKPRFRAYAAVSNCTPITGHHHQATQYMLDYAEDSGGSSIFRAKCLMSTPAY